MSLVLRLHKRPACVTQHSNAFGGDAAEFTAPHHRSKLGTPKMTIEDSLQSAIQDAREGRGSFLHYVFDTPGGAVEFYAQIELSGDTIFCKDVCVYPLSDPPGIKKEQFCQSRKNR